MNAHKTSVLYSLITFVILILISLYRQISMMQMPDDLLRPIIVYIVYVLLLGVWLYSIVHRFTQMSMKYFLYGEIAIMLFWISVRFLQDEWFYKKTTLMRESGYLIVIPLVFIPLLGIYAALGLGKGENYYTHRKWLWLLVPSTFLTVIMLTNEFHFWVFQVQVEDYGRNLKFYPNVGIYMIALWAAALEVIKIILIFQRGYHNKHSSYLRYVPFVIAMLMPVYTIPYFLSSFSVSKELIEFSAGLFFFEAVTWESCVAADMIPVNTGYTEMFNHSTMGLQVFDENDELLAKSMTAADISEEQFRLLKQYQQLEVQDNLELYLHRIQNQQLIWQRDLTQIRTAIAELKQTAEELEEDGALLREEIWARSEEVKTQMKNQFYDQLTGELGGQLHLMNQWIEQNEDMPEEMYFRYLSIIGTYIKRRCNLRLTAQETGEITYEDMQISIEDFVSLFRDSGIDVSVWWKEVPLNQELFLFAFDVLELLIEHEKFIVDKIEITWGAVNVSICIKNMKKILNLPVEKVSEKNQNRFQMAWNAIANGYQIILVGEEFEDDVFKKSEN